MELVYVLDSKFKFCGFESRFTYQLKGVTMENCPECEKEFKTGFDCYQHHKDAHGLGKKVSYPKYRVRYLNKEPESDHLTEADYQTWMRL